MNCLCCNSDRLAARDTVISGFIGERVFGVTDRVLPARLYHCKACGFAFYDRRFTNEEAARLYAGYRSDEYQRTRQKYDSWYTPEVNRILEDAPKGLANRRAVIGRICQRYLPKKVSSALDYGGGVGSIYPAGLNIDKQYVYDISSVDTVPGTIRLDSYPSAQSLAYDLVMCNHVLEHVSDLDEFVQSVIALGGEATLFYFEVPFDSPFYGRLLDNVQYLFNPHFSLKVIIERFIKMLRPGYFAPLTEHINYFTPDALEKVLVRPGLEVIDLQVNKINSEFANGRCISAVCRRP